MLDECPTKDTYLISEERGYFLLKNHNSLLGKGRAILFL